MKKTLFLVTLLLLMFPIVSAFSTTNIIAYYNFTSSTLNDASGGIGALTNNGATLGVSGIADEAVDFEYDSTDQWISTPGMTESVYSINVWVKPESFAGYGTIIGGSVSDKRIAVIHAITTGEVGYFVGDGSNWCWSPAYSSSQLSTGSWTMLTAVYDGSTAVLYLDGSPLADQNNSITGSCTGHSINGYYFQSGIRYDYSDSYQYDGVVDELMILDYPLNSHNVTELYASGAGIFYPFEGASPSDNFTVSVTDYWNTNPINGINVTIDSITYENITGSVVTTHILVNDTNTYTVTVEGSNHFEREFPDVDPTEGTLSATLYGSDITFTAYELISEDLLGGGNFTVNTTTGSNTTHFYFAPGSNLSVLAENTGYFNKTQSFNVTPLFNGTINVTEIFSGYLNISAVNAYTTNPILNFSGYIYHPGSGNNRSFNTSSGSVNVTTIPGDFTIYLEADNYSISSDNYENITINESGQNITFSLYSSNSIIIYIKDEDSGLTITDNITIVLTGDNESTYSTTTGSYFLENLTDGNYSLKFSGDNYTLRTYTVTVAERSTQILTAYLTATSDTVTMTYLDEDSGATLEGVSASMSRLLGGVWTVVQSKESDITGRIQFIYTPSVKYKFTASLSGYDDKIFYLDPVIFDSYNVKMSKETTITDAPIYQGVSITISPTVFYNDEQNNLTITVISPDGLLSYYYYNITYPTGGSTGGGGSNAYGEEMSDSINITGSSWTDTVRINVTYDTTIGSPKSLVYYYEIRDPTVDPGVFTDNQNNTYGLGLFERILITMITVIVVIGVLSLLGGFLLGIPIGMILLGYLMFIGFMPLWAGLPSLFVVFILIVARTT